MQPYKVIKKCLLDSDKWKIVLEYEFDQARESWLAFKELVEIALEEWADPVLITYSDKHGVLSSFKNK